MAASSIDDAADGRGSGHHPDPGTGPGTPRDGRSTRDAEPALVGRVVAGTVGLVGVAGLGLAADAGVGVGLGAVAGASLAVALVLLNAEGPLGVAAGTAIAVPAMVGAVVAPLVGPSPALVAACSLATFGAAATVLDVLGRGRMVEGLGVATYGLVPLGVTAIVVALWPAAGRIADVVREAVVPAAAGPDLLGFSLLAGLAVASLRGAVGALPAAELSPRDRREAVAERVEAVERVLTRALRVTLFGVLAGMGLWVLVVFEPGAVPAVVTDLLAATAGSGAVRLALIAVTTAALAVLAATWAVRWTGGTLVDRTRRGAAAVTGILVTLSVVAVHERVFREVFAAAPTRGRDLLSSFARVLGTLPTVLLVVSVVLLSFVLLALLVPAVVGLELAPERSVAPALAAAGLVGGAALGARATGPVVAFGAVAAAMVVYDVGEHAVGYGEEVGEAAAVAPQVVHAIASLCVGAIAVALAAFVLTLVAGRSAGGPLAVAALAAATLGVLFLTAMLRG